MKKLILFLFKLFKIKNRTRNKTININKLPKDKQLELLKYCIKNNIDISETGAKTDY